MPFGSQPPDWFQFEFGGPHATAGANVLRNAADEARVHADAEHFCQEYNLDDRCMAYLLTRPA
eukprot:6050900-Alexandrium_andersonii.AAC.1